MKTRANLEVDVQVTTTNSYFFTVFRTKKGSITYKNNNYPLLFSKLSIKIHCTQDIRLPLATQRKMFFFSAESCSPCNVATF